MDDREKDRVIEKRLRPAAPEAIKFWTDQGEIASLGFNGSAAPRHPGFKDSARGDVYILLGMKSDRKLPLDGQRGGGRQSRCSTPSARRSGRDRLTVSSA